MSRRELIEFAIVAGIGAACELFVLAGFLFAVLVGGVAIWL